MLSQFKNILFFLTLGYLCYPQLIIAGVYPVRNGNTDVVYFGDPFVDADLNSWLVDHAEHSIEVVNYLQTTDPLGLSFIQALRRAQNRGIPIKYLYDGSQSVKETDSYGDAGKLLTDSEVGTPSQILTLVDSGPGPIALLRSLRDRQKSKAGLSPNDTIHHKFLIIDRGKASEKIVIKGMNYNAFSLGTMDSGIVIRPLDPSQPYVGTDIKADFDRSFEYFASHFPFHPNAPLSPRLKKLATQKIPPFSFDQKQHQELAEITKLLSVPPKETDLLQPFQFRPENGQLVTNHTPIEVMERRIGPSLQERAQLKSDISLFIGELLRNSSQVHMQSYAFAPTLELKSGIIDAVNGGTDFHLLTNGKEAHNSVPAGRKTVGKILRGIGLFSSVYDYNLSNVHAVMEATNSGSGTFNVSVYNADKVRELEGPESRGLFIHKKLIVADDCGLFPSDNFTRAAAGRNTEAATLFKDPRLAEFLRAKLQAQGPLFDPLDRKTVKAATDTISCKSSLFQRLIVQDIY